MALLSDFARHELPKSDLPEIAHRLKWLREHLEEVDDDLTRREVYDRVGTAATVIGDVASDVEAVARALRAVTGP